jgi:hypothetical protein
VAIAKCRERLNVGEMEKRVYVQMGDNAERETGGERVGRWKC